MWCASRVRAHHGSRMANLCSIDSPQSVFDSPTVDSRTAYQWLMTVGRMHMPSTSPVLDGRHRRRGSCDAPVSTLDARVLRSLWLPLTALDAHAAAERWPALRLSSAETSERSNEEDTADDTDAGAGARRIWHPVGSHRALRRVERRLKRRVERGCGAARGGLKLHEPFP